MATAEDSAAAAQRKLEIVGFIATYRAQHGYGPPRAEIARHFGVSSSTVDNYLRDLRQRGLITWDHNVAHSLRTT